MLLAFMVAIMATQVFLRYAFSAALPWAEEAVRFSMIWMSLLAAAVVVWRRGHISVDIFVSRMPRPLHVSCRVVVGLCGIAFCCVLLVKSIAYLDVVKITTAPALGITLDWVYAVLPVGAVMMLVSLVRHLLSDIGAAMRPGSSNEGPQDVD